MYFIYRITNKLNGKVYVGRTTQNPKTRLRQHIAGMGFGKKMPIHLAIQKHGIDNFDFEVVYTGFNISDAGYAELYFINEYNSIAPNGYNVDLNTKFLKDNPYLIGGSNMSSAVQSIEGEPTSVEYNPSTRARYPVELWKQIRSLYLSGKCPKDINSTLNTNIPIDTMTKKLRGLGCDTSSKARNKIRGNGRFLITDSESALVVEDFKKGLKTKQLEKKYNRANATIRKILVLAGVYISVDKKICRTAL